MYVFFQQRFAISIFLLFHTYGFLKAISPFLAIFVAVPTKMPG